MSSEKQNITIDIEGRKYPLQVDRSREIIYRNAERGIRTKTNEFRKSYQFKKDPLGREFDFQDFLSMAILHFALTSELETGDKKRLIRAIEELDNELELLLGV